MIDKELYLKIVQKYGHYASWAVWANEGIKPKSNIGDLRVFDIEINPNLLNILKPNIVMVGFNISRRIEFTFGNFHDRRAQAQDYKIRYAFKNTKFEGAYMTDIIKDFENITAGNVIAFLRKEPEFEKKNLEVFKEELLDINSTNPLLIAYGVHTYEILKRNFEEKYKIIRIPHYSNYISKEAYKNKVKEILGY